MIQLQNELIWHQYRVSRYREFYVYEPKKRLIMALPFRDRVVQWAVYRIINPLLDRQFIEDSFACRIGKGTHHAADRLQYWLRSLNRRYPKVYALKLDISKYFYRVDHAVLKEILRKKFADPDLIRYMDDMLVLHPDKKYLHEVKEILGAFLADELHLTLNRKTGIRLANQGIDFVGYRIWPTHRRVRRRTVKKIKQRLRQMAILIYCYLRKCPGSYGFKR